ncbi:Uncharacterised protein [Slackia heliotrinireducens]|uniref:RloB family protein n=1 Tax=Slackia heliotrinireducens TaxID=84110 RepID=UPI0001A36F43|nr:RloB family protein [Slackia heliotrinireducens]VEH00480.1 Uncharacterised protein [Slackia heliotrinireducens]
MGKRDLRRKPGNRPPKDRIYILTEGEATEIEYLKGICARLGLPKELVIIKKACNTDPKGIVDELVSAKKQNARLAKRGNDALIDQWWAVFDTEGRPHDLSAVVQKAKDNRVYLAISDPSFEFWLRLHFGYTTASYDSVGKLIKELRDSGYLPKYSEDNKHPDMDILYPLLPQAMKNARLLRAKHTQLGNDQPRTDCDLLIDAIAQQSRVSQLQFDPVVLVPEQLSMHICY